MASIPQAGVVAVTQVSVQPNQCLVQAPITVKGTLSVPEALSNVQWTVKFVADAVGPMAQSATLYTSSEPLTVAAGVAVPFELHCAPIVVDEIPGEALLNVGILHVILEPFGAATPVLDIAPPNTVSAAAADSGAEAAAARPYVHLKCVTQVSKTGICGDYVRTSFNPLRAE